MAQTPQKNQLTDSRTENRQRGEYGVPEAPPADQSHDSKAGLRVDGKPVSYTKAPRSRTRRS